jgi:hypothetical protein
MGRWIAPLAVSLPLVVLAGSQTSPLMPSALRIPDPLSPRDVGYHITARLIPEAKQIRGSVNVVISNTSGRPVDKVLFHLYLNAFAGPESLFMRQGKGQMRLSQADPSEPGWIKVTRVQQDKRPAAHRKLHDGTVLLVDLPRPVPPRERITLSLDFTSRLPRVFARTGHADDFFMVAQWYPKPGVLRPDGTWHCPPFSAFSEFFADFATYEVILRLPKDHLVGATGVQVHRETDGEDQVLIFRAEDVHDFALTVWPHFTEDSFRIDDVKVRILSVPGRNQSSRIQRLVREALTRLQRWFRAYPYAQLTVVDVPSRALGASGMEYPTLFTTWTPWWSPAGLHFVDEVTVHELVHQYFQGMLASNEVEEPWLDEGMTTYVTWLIMDELFGEDRSFIDAGPLKLGIRHRGPLHLTRDGRVLPIARPARTFSSWKQLGLTVYTRAALLLKTVESMIGRQRMLDILGKYSRRFAFKHPTTADLERALVDGSPAAIRPAVSELLRGTLHRSQTVDYAVHCFEDRVVVERKGTLDLPLLVSILTSNGRLHHHRIAGKDRSHCIDHPGVRAASLGPAVRLGLDPTPLDNRCATRGDAVRPAALWTTIAQHLLQLVGP